MNSVFLAFWFADIVYSLKALLFITGVLMAVFGSFIWGIAAIETHESTDKTRFLRNLYLNTFGVLFFLLLNAIVPSKETVLAGAATGAVLEFSQTETGQKTGVLLNGTLDYLNKLLTKQWEEEVK